MATKRTSKASKTGTLRKEHKVSLPNTMNTEYFQPGVKVWLENPYDEGTSAYRINHLSNSISTRPMYVPAIITENFNFFIFFSLFEAFIICKKFFFG